MLQSTLGDSLKEIDATDKFEEIPSPDPFHIQIKATSNAYGDYHIRLRDYGKNVILFLGCIKEEYECINLYYTYVNKQYGQKCPSFYQYRITPDDEKTIPNHIFDCQEYMGEFFLKVYLLA